jgi:hypothetical protein
MLTLLRSSFRTMHGGRLFANMRSRLQLATNSVKERKMIEAVFNGQKVCDAFRCMCVSLSLSTYIYIYIYIYI